MRKIKWQRISKWTVIFLGLTLFMHFLQTKASQGKAGEKTSLLPMAMVEDQKHPEADFSISCLECHQEVTPEITTEWNEGKHGQVHIGCFICHGDGEVEFFAKPNDMSCASCHSAKEVDFTQVEATTCFSCHGGHGLKFHAY